MNGSPKTELEFSMRNFRTICIVPARGGSKGLPGKNKKMLIDRPLVAWPITSALDCPFIDQVICSTDDPEIQAIAIQYGAIAPFIRPADLSSDTAKTSDVILHAINYAEEILGEYYDYVVLLEPTSPLTTSEDVSNAFNLLIANRTKATSIVGVSKVESTHPEYDVRLDNQGFISPYLVDDFSLLRRRQEIEELYFLEGSVYISEVDAFKTHKSFYHSKTLGYEVPRWKSIEIDELIDFLMVETIMNNVDVLK